MRNILRGFYIIISAFFLLYLALPGPSFPTPPPDSLQSQEPGDTETPLRRAYFTNYTREEVMGHYVSEFSFLPNLDIKVPTYRLNYPPEEAQTIIRDQTRSTFLEEVVHPFRESVYINGFKPKSEKDTILIDDRVWLQKITVRHVPSNPFARVLVGIFTVSLLYTLFFEWKKTIRAFRKVIKNG